jgi:hypothetical protein
MENMPASDSLKDFAAVFIAAFLAGLVAKLIWGSIV